MPKRLPRARTLKGDPKLVYYDSGGGLAGEPPIVLVHGHLARSEDWENVFPRLATRYRVIAYDQRGHGKSGRAERYELAAFVDDLVRILRDVARAPAVVIGHSQGGVVALCAAAAAPELVRGLVLEDPPLARFGAAWDPRVMGPLAEALKLRDDPVAFARAVARLPLERPGPRGERTLGETRGFYSAERMVGYYAGVDPAFVAWRLAGPDPSAESLVDGARVSLPVLLLVGDTRLGSVVDEACLAKVTERAADLTVERVVGAGHRIHGLRPEPFLEAIEPFLRKLRSG